MDLEIILSSAPVGGQYPHLIDRGGIFRDAHAPVLDYSS